MLIYVRERRLILQSMLLHKDAFFSGFPFLDRMFLRSAASLRRGCCGVFVCLRFFNSSLFTGKWASKLDKCRSCSPSWPDTWWKWPGGCENNWSLLCMPGRRTAVRFYIALMFLWTVFSIYVCSEQIKDMQPVGSTACQACLIVLL